jgi:hypothetical protein
MRVGCGGREQGWKLRSSPDGTFAAVAADENASGTDVSPSQRLSFSNTDSSARLAMRVSIL